MEKEYGKAKPAVGNLEGGSPANLRDWVNRLAAGMKGGPWAPQEPGPHLPRTPPTMRALLQDQRAEKGKWGEGPGGKHSCPGAELPKFFLGSNT